MYVFHQGSRQLDNFLATIAVLCKSSEIPLFRPKLDPASHESECRQESLFRHLELCLKCRTSREEMRF